MSAGRPFLAAVLALGCLTHAHAAGWDLDDKALPSRRSKPAPPYDPLHLGPLPGDYSSTVLPSLTSTHQDSPRDDALIREAYRQEPETVFSQSELGFDGQRMAAMRAVRITLEYSPQILLQDTDVQGREGATRVAQGEFDTHVTGRAQADVRERRRDQFTRDLPGASASPSPYPNPLVRRSSLYEFELGLRQKLRNGVVVEPKVGFRPSINNDYNNNFDNTNDGYASFDVLIPLAKGGGRLVNQAPEIAARFDLLASVLRLRFLTSQSIRDTIQAYWNCRAAEERYKLYLESEAISMRLIKMSAALVEADELAPAQLPQILADRNSTTAYRIRAEAELILARQRLAISMGFSPESLIMAPLAADEFPEPPARSSYPDLNDLWFSALRLRDDVRSAQQLEKSRKVLMDASFLELRPRLDLQLRATYLPFENRTGTTTSQGGEFGGFAAMSLDWPIQNNTAIGSYIQNTASYEASRINLEDLRRATVSGVISAMAEVRSSDAEVRRYAEAARFNAEALRAQEELFRLGQVNLTDTITSRQRLVQSQLDYVNARERYAISLVQLRFETGMLFFSDESGGWVDARAWQTIPFVK